MCRGAGPGQGSAGPGWGSCRRAQGQPGAVFGVRKGLYPLVTLVRTGEGLAFLCSRDTASAWGLGWSWRRFGGSRSVLTDGLSGLFCTGLVLPRAGGRTGCDLWSSPPAPLLYVSVTRWRAGRGVRTRLPRFPRDPACGQVPGAFRSLGDSVRRGARTRSWRSAAAERGVPQPKQLEQHCLSPARLGLSPYGYRVYSGGPQHLGSGLSRCWVLLIPPEVPGGAGQLAQALPRLPNPTGLSPLGEHSLLLASRAIVPWRWDESRARTAPSTASAWAEMTAPCHERRPRDWSENSYFAGN